LNNDLAPTYQRLFGLYWVLWYSKSNNYSIVAPEFKLLLDYYFDSSTPDTFGSKVKLTDPLSDTAAIACNLNTYLERCNTSTVLGLASDLSFQPIHRNIVKQYIIEGKHLEINFDTELVQNTIHPAIAHLEVDQNATSTPLIFDVYLDKDYLCFFKNEELITAVPKRDYHLLQGKFVMQLLSLVHDCDESDWLGTFHGSTIANGEHSILFVGQSGKGKSTLCALLVAHGYELVADDVSPMHSEDGHIYHNPSAISIKTGAFSTLQPLVRHFDALPTTLFNTTKGPLKYIPCKNPARSNYPCNTIIMVNYEPNATTHLEPISIKTCLETLIPDSWLSPEPAHALQFLDWLESTEMYQLTYSDTTSVLAELSAVFNQLKDD
jgi:hypothetical protein